MPVFYCLNEERPRGNSAASSVPGYVTSSCTELDLSEPLFDSWVGLFVTKVLLRLICTMSFLGNDLVLWVINSSQKYT